MVGIARMAARSPRLSSKRRVEYFELGAESILNRCPNPRLPFRWTINPYRGCELGCTYCYARYTHEFMGFENPKDFEEKIYSKAQAGKILGRELRQNPGGSIAIGTATDPYQPAERIYGTTRSVLETIANFRGLQISVTTKSDLVTRDIDLLRAISTSNSLRVHITITTLDPGLTRLLEPLAPLPELRLAAIRKLADAGLFVTINTMPVLPGITDSADNLEDVALAGAKAGARDFHVNMLFLTPSTKKAFFPFLDVHFPALAARYRKLYARGAYLHGPVNDRLHSLARRLRGRYFPFHADEEGNRRSFGLRAQSTLFDAREARSSASEPYWDFGTE